MPAASRLLKAPSFAVAFLFVTSLAVPALQARTAGQLLKIDVAVSGTFVELTLFDTAIAELDGGATLFGSTSPGGPIIARVPLPLPYTTDPETKYASFLFNGVPPGTYYLAMVSGNVAAPNVPPASWTPLVIGGGCSGPPAIGSVVRNQQTPPGTLSLLLASADGCATSFDLDAGTTPGGRELGTLSFSNQVLVAATPPPGHYYVRVRGRNAFGAGPWSDVLPISVPGCTAQWAPALNATATVAGNTVTLSWTPAPGSPANTFQELWLFHARVANQNVPTVLIPAGTTSLSGAVPPGNYNVAVVAGNACGKDPVASFVFTVP